VSHAPHTASPYATPHPSPSLNTPRERAAIGASELFNVNNAIHTVALRNVNNSTSVNISCGECALLERRHVASSRAPPQQNITVILCAHRLRFPFKMTAAQFLPYFQA
jgi:hypothetical protein